MENPLDDVLANDLHKIFAKEEVELWVGNVHCIRQDVFNALHISAVVNCAPTTETPTEFSSTPCVRLSMADSIHPALNVDPFLWKAIDFIDGCVKKQEGRNVVLIHCFGGQNRSPTICAAYLIARQGFSAKDACDLLKEKRELVKIGPVYRMALDKFEKTIKQ